MTAKAGQWAKLRDISAVADIAGVNALKLH